MLIAVCLAAAVTVQTPEIAPHPFPIETSYDRIRDESDSSLHLGNVFEDEDEDLQVEASLHDLWKGLNRAPLEPKDNIYLRFGSTSKSWEFLKTQDLVILAGQRRIRPGRPHSDRSIKRGGVSEALVFALTRAELEALAKADAVEFSLGTREFQLNPSQQEAVKDFAERMALSSKDAEQREAGRAVGRMERTKVLQKAMDGAVEAARKAVRNLPKRKRAASANDVGIAKVREAFAETREKYKVAPEEVIGLLQKYPEFRSDSAEE